MRIWSHGVARPWLFLAIVLGMLTVALFSLDVKAQQSGPSQRLFPSDSAVNDGFGIVISLDQDTLVVNAKEAAYIFEREVSGANEVWQEAAKITIPGVPTPDLILRASDVQSDTVVIGISWSEEDEFEDHSEVYIYDRNQGGADNWGLVKKLVAAEDSLDDDFGAALALDGDLLAVGASDIDVDANPGVTADEGAVFLYGRNIGGANNWGLIKQITQDDGNVNDEFGLGIDLQGDVLAVGAVNVDLDGVAGEDHGAVFLFGRNIGGADNWGLIKRVTAIEAAENTKFGGRLRLDGDMLVASSGLDDDLDGAVHIFARNMGGADSWGAVTKVVAPAGDGDVGFGYGVDLLGDRLLVGSPLVARCGRANQGAVYVFTRNAGGADNWGLEERLAVGRGQHSFFGFDILMDERTTIISAPNLSEDNTTNAGLAYINPDSAGACTFMPFAQK